MFYLNSYLKTIIVVFLIIITSCQKKETVDNYIGQKIIWPDSTLVIKKDSLSSNIYDLNNSQQYKVVNIFNANCIKCIDGYNKLNEFLNQINENFECIFLINIDNYKYFKHYIYPELNKSNVLIWNKNNRFEKLNHLEGTYKLFDTFILNKKNEIVYLGNPITSNKIKADYINLLSK